LADFFAELKRRQIYRVGAAYVIVAWALIQLVEILEQIFALPLWIAQAAIIVMALGFPVALLAAWMIESRPHQAVAFAVRSKPTIVDWTLCGALAAVLLFMGYQQVAPFSDATTQQPGVDAARSASLNSAAAVSLAVLPFTNLSGDAGQEFFSDGMTEEITSVLAKIPDLRVVGRTSAFQFKGQNDDLRTIGQALNATHLLEGSVRKEGNRLRITAQLIKSNDGVHVWTESYDRELTGVFVIQEEIATAIAGALRMPLGLKPGERLLSHLPVDPQSYQDYLRAKTLLRGRGPQNPSAISDAIKLLEQAVLRDPDFAAAWGFLGTAYRLIPRFDPVRLSGATEKARPVVEASLVKAESAAQHALRLDLKNSDGLQALGDVKRMERNYIAGVDLYLRALALDPDNPDILNTYSVTLAELGLLQQALPVRQRLRTLEPLVPLFNGVTSLMLWSNGQIDAATALVPNRAGNQGAVIAASIGRFGEAADLLESLRTDDAVYLGRARTAARLLRTAPSVAASPKTLPQLGIFGWGYVYLGAPDRVMEYYEGNIKIGYTGGMEIAPLWGPSFGPVRKTERFKTFVRDAGMLVYWRERGWPEFCRPTTGDDFECQ
jgi:adenylate cyclase